MILSDPTCMTWTAIDYKLVKAHYLKGNMMSGNFPIWIDSSPRVEFEAKSLISKSEAAVQRAAKNDSSKGEGTPGKRFYAIPHVMDGGKMPTMREYIDEQEKVRKVQGPYRFSGLGPVMSELID